jgi:phage tail sheath protein FI
LDPDVEQTSDDVPLKQVPLIGMILGRESLVARQFDGFHKAPSGVDVTLPDVLELTTGDPETAVILNEELTNPQGVNLVKFRQGVAILWGDRTISPTSAWRFHHQRALMSHYENILRENFDWIVFAINEPKTQERAKTTLRAFFLPEWVKGALRGDKFSDAFKLKIDEEINTDLTRSLGDLNAELKLKLADTVERFKMIIGKAGIFDAVE